MAQEKAANPKGKDEASSNEIPDAELDKVVGAGLASIPVGNVIRKENNFGGDDWGKK